ncbi:uncharacterized protein PV09_01903 [Verruconis gallopava]|uniref:Methyltransferase domain-containing protein n=1 Tax=Verruconis gallopava TaxID=253628 RepID=A0A0D2AJF6_9PEZI|nr:uncharacterized protein PV09_01903 [Verruconis gallopava]KIW07008.1 hypothetical protein PV09_01903 [Verruconis gallopava]
MKLDSVAPESPLPLPPGFTDVEEYVDSLLIFTTSSPILHTLCGGVHILDFLTRSPDLYSSVIPASWRQWFAHVDVQDVLDLLMREDQARLEEAAKAGRQWRGHPPPPPSLIEYVRSVKKHLLNREFEPLASRHGEARSNKQIFAGMNPKKIHEVDNFARYVDSLASDIDCHNGHCVTHLADFGAGQNYLGRVLASAPYNRNIVAIESRAHVVEGAKGLDVNTKVVKKPLVMRNKKLFRARKTAGRNEPSSTPKGGFGSGIECENSPDNRVEISDDTSVVGKTHAVGQSDLEPSRVDRQGHDESEETTQAGGGTIQYIEHRIVDGDLSSVIEHIKVPSHANSSQRETEAPAVAYECGSRTVTRAERTEPVTPGRNCREGYPVVMVISLHSCGNLVHHGLRTLVLNPSVKAVALVGCCYNLMTERLGPPTHKLHRRRHHPRLDATAGTYDPNGFPMSERFVRYKYRVIPHPDFSLAKSCDEKALAGCESSEFQAEAMDDTSCDDIIEGIRLNITARMMAVQAPENWTEGESSSFFKRHFYRAVLQRIFLDKGVVSAPPNQEDDMGCSPAGSSWGLANSDGGGTAPIVIGNLKKKNYESFNTYVRGAVEKLIAGGGEIAEVIEAKVGNMSDDEIRSYEQKYWARKKDMSILWSMMAFSAGVVEAMIVVDRWLWLKEQACIKHAWVQPVFSYALSPRNLVIVGIK